jgi:hypothetical protein
MFPLLGYYRRTIRAIARDADSILAVSPAMLDWAIEYSGRSKSDLDRVFYLGFRRHAQDRNIEVPKLFTPDNPLICLFATTCGKSYHGEMLIDAARLLESQGERRIRFIVSGDGDMRSLWMARAVGLESVHFTGWISHQELQSYFRTAHLGLILLKGGIAQFWLGNKIFEYLSAFLGVVNDVPGASAEIVRNWNLGVNIKQQDPRYLARSLSALIDDPPRVRTYMENSKHAFLQTFDREAVETQYIEHLKNVMSGRLEHK